MGGWARKVARTIPAELRRSRGITWKLNLAAFGKIYGTHLRPPTKHTTSVSIISADGFWRKVNKSYVTVVPVAFVFVYFSDM